MSTKDKILGVQSSAKEAGGAGVSGVDGASVVNGSARRPVNASGTGADAVRDGAAGMDNVQAGAGTGANSVRTGAEAGARPAQGAATTTDGDNVQAGAGTGARPAQGAATTTDGGLVRTGERGVHEFLTPEQVVSEHVRPTAPVVNGAGTGSTSVERDAWPDEFKRRFPQVLDKNGNVDASKLRELKAADYLDYLQKVKAQNADETDEERKKRLRREKWSRIYNGIGDMVSALSNLYFTTKGAPSADQSNSLSKAYQARLDKMDAEREKRRKELENAYRLEYATGSQLAKDKASEDYQRARSEAVRTKSLGEAMRLNAQADLLEKQGKKAEADALRAQAVAAYYDVLKAGKEIDNKYKPQVYDDKHSVAQSTVERNNAQANNANASAKMHNRQGTSSWVSPSGSKGGKSGGKSGGKGGYPWYDKNAILHYAKTEGVAKQMSKQNGTYVDDYATNTSTDESGTKKSSRTHSGWHSQKPARPAHGGGKGRFSGFSIHKKR